MTITQEELKPNSRIEVTVQGSGDGKVWSDVIDSQFARVVVTSGSPLSRRQFEVLRWLADGKRPKDIALILGVSKSAINGHVENVKVALGLDTTVAIVARALRAGWIKCRGEGSRSPRNRGKSSGCSGHILPGHIR
jgi:DNA-binding CsgD family transcriptional regulator